MATPRGTTFHVEGEATPAYLHSGLLVQLNAKVEGREIKEPIHELTITSKVHKTAHSPASATKPAGKGEGAGPASLASESAKIVGQLGHTQGDKWLLHVGEKSYRIELADDLKIKVALSNGHLISAGDKIVIHGEAVPSKPALYRRRRQGDSGSAARRKKQAQVVRVQAGIGRKDRIG